MSFAISIVLGALGACMGSYAGATVWRLRARQLAEDTKAGEKVDAGEFKRLKPLLSSSFWKDRSIDFDTGKQLPWYDMIPIVSWLMLKGKSRFSGKPIGKFEFIIEVAVALAFVISYIVWPFDLSSFLGLLQFGLWLTALVVLAILFAYDTKWFLLPDRANYLLVVVGVIYCVLLVFSTTAPILDLLLDIAGAVFVLSGIYYIIYVLSRGQWIGFGDIKLGLGLALLLADWRLALIALLMANLIGTLMVLPGLIRGKLKAGTHVPFGPLLIIGTVIAKLWGYQLITWYLSLTL